MLGTPPTQAIHSFFLGTVFAVIPALAFVSTVTTRYVCHYQSFLFNPIWIIHFMAKKFPPQGRDKDQGENMVLHEAWPCPIKHGARTIQLSPSLTRR